MQVRAVVFDWAGTLTPWDEVDFLAHWKTTGRAIDPELAEDLGNALHAAERELAKRCLTDHSSMTLGQIFAAAGVPCTDLAIEAYFEAWEPHTITDPDGPSVLEELRRRGLRVGVLSNTAWSRRQHEMIFERDGVLGLIDAAVYSSEIPWTKPHPEAFHAILRELGVVAPGDAVFVGDRLFEDVQGAQSVGMRTVFIPHSTIPEEQLRDTAAVPDATIQKLADLVPVVDGWS